MRSARHAGGTLAATAVTSKNPAAAKYVGPSNAPTPKSCCCKSFPGNIDTATPPAVPIAARRKPCPATS